MKALVIHAAKDLRITEQCIQPPGKGEVQVAISVGGICGSDLHYYQHGGFGTVKLREPMVLGHEVAGHIAALGEGVDTLRIGQLVAVSPSRPCNDCPFCLEGMKNHCLNMRFYGSAMPYPHIQGAFRQVLNADVSQCIAADGLSASEAAMAEPLAVCLHATRRAGTLAGKSVLVTGCGPIGILSILCARQAGADLVVATDLTDFTLSIAKSVGADVAVNMQDKPHGLDQYCANKGTFDLLYECSGAEQALAAGVHTMRPGGTIMQLGLGGDMTLPMMTMTSKELSLKGSFRFHEEFESGVNLMREGLIDVKPLITQEVSLAEAVRGFDLASDRSLSMKTQISFAEE